MLCIVISIIVGIFAIEYYKKKRADEKRNKEIEMRGCYYNRISDIMRNCWDEKSRIFLIGIYGLPDGMKWFGVVIKLF